MCFTNFINLGNLEIGGPFASFIKLGNHVIGCVLHTLYN